ncbi:PREDICTED: mitogen-activated protein kinase kinase kinase 2-like [Nelumbo nucifera]|uniref:Protein kinase domain-containing protein n=2 Tax=Nelumbo nucifera TaxID=4432 RepID=A0A822XRD2_NELNU|nr:PREDICTED: mitogen-activated protein kinase kinase kinase 2-like [Nelumbo nucifera]DAD21526.1 TPA_asm: hypothetical protein HUJ06_022989 [Nelumbo nucifera]
MEWTRGKPVGRGSFATVNLAIPTSDNSLQLVQVPQLMVVKSAVLSESSSLQVEKEILTHLRGCPQILPCFGDDLTVENGKQIYNIFLEYASGGTLADLLKKSGGSLLESDVRRYTRSILRGLRFIHANGYVHCDIKLQNILLCSSPDGSNEIKVADFGLAKKAAPGQEIRRTEGGAFGLRGTPLYMSPESIAHNEHEAPADIWALGCAVSEMVMGKPAWKCGANTDVSALLFRIGFGEELPEIPGGLSAEGKDFLSKCLVRDPEQRWTAEMLLNHPFVADEAVVLCEPDVPSPSPRSPFDFPEWSSSPRSSISNSESCTSSGASSSSSVLFSTRSEEQLDRRDSITSSLVNRIRHLVTGQGANWSTSGSWITVREAESSSVSR